MARDVKRRKLRQVNVGDMREEIEIHTFEQKVGGFDDPSFCDQYVLKYTVFAMVETIETIGGGEQLFDKINLNENQTHKFSIRFIDDLSTEQRIIWNNRIYKIIRIDDPNGRRQYSVVFAQLFGDKTTKANT